MIGLHRWISDRRRYVCYLLAHKGSTAYAMIVVKTERSNDYDGSLFRVRNLDKRDDNPYYPTDLDLQACLKTIFEDTYWPTLDVKL
jgi:hypothetical protein